MNILTHVRRSKHLPSQVSKSKAIFPTNTAVYGLGAHRPVKCASSAWECQNHSTPANGFGRLFHFR